MLGAWQGSTADRDPFRVASLMAADAEARRAPTGSPDDQLPEEVLSR